MPVNINIYNYSVSGSEGRHHRPAIRVNTFSDNPNGSAGHDRLEDAIRTTFSRHTNLERGLSLLNHPSRQIEAPPALSRSNSVRESSRSQRSHHSQVNPQELERSHSQRSHRSRSISRVDLPVRRMAAGNQQRVGNQPQPNPLERVFARRGGVSNQGMGSDEYTYAQPKPRKASDKHFVVRNHIDGGFWKEPKSLSCQKSMK